MSDEETVNLLQPASEEVNPTLGKFRIFGLSKLDYRNFKRILANVYYEWNKPSTYIILLCVNTYIIISCLCCIVPPTITTVLEFFVMITFTFEILAKGILRGLSALWENDGKIDTITYVMCFISLFGTQDYSVPDDYSNPNYANVGDRYLKISIVSFRIIAQLLRLSRTFICHYKAKTKCENHLWIEMEEAI